MNYLTKRNLVDTFSIYQPYTLYDLNNDIENLNHKELNIQKLQELINDLNRDLNLDFEDEAFEWSKYKYITLQEINKIKECFVKITNTNILLKSQNKIVNISKKIKKIDI